MTLAVAVSGGMDSLLALALLKERGGDLLAVHGFFLPQKNEDTAARLAGQCAALSIPFHALDLRKQFQAQVADGFVEAYAQGRTPNPCAQCNPVMKFGALFDAARSLGANRFATGHYARLLDHPDLGRLLVRGADPAKDQSYFLSLVPKALLEQAVFPLGDLHKAAVPGELARRGLTVPLPGESQEICF
ncbi:MAG: tRNA 2-thiouridine(34) synthase MnmA, partial [Proteobacteria bacterium]|nr:tRNA 2-thiouridine(34) synthase MnmA [Pseudomonadota bacterium]MBU1610664.1 tRNA 2-thiouridine(34) synthase MnmA [Pseudomonadota bacterium]